MGETAGEDTNEDVAEEVEENDRRCVCLCGRGKSCNSLKSYPNNGFRLKASSRRQAWLQYNAFPEKIFWSQTGHQFKSLMGLFFKRKAQPQESVSGVGWRTTNDWVEYRKGVKREVREKRKREEEAMRKEIEEIFFIPILCVSYQT
jgi:hypothetical protein